MYFYLDCLDIRHRFCLVGRGDLTRRMGLTLRTIGLTHPPHTWSPILSNIGILCLKQGENQGERPIWFGNISQRHLFVLMRMLLLKWWPWISSILWSIRLCEEYANEFQHLCFSNTNQFIFARKQVEVLSWLKRMLGIKSWWILGEMVVRRRTSSLLLTMLSYQYQLYPSC